MGRLDFIDQDEYENWKNRQKARERQRELDAQPKGPTSWQLAMSRPSFAPEPDISATMPISGGTTAPLEAPEPTPWQRAWQPPALPETMPDYLRQGLDMGQQQLRQRVPGYAGAADVLGRGLQAETELGKRSFGKTMEGLDWLNRNVNMPQRELMTGPAARGEIDPRLMAAASPEDIEAFSAATSGMRVGEALKRGQRPGQIWQEAGQRWEETQEPAPGVKGILEATVPSELALGVIPFEKAPQLAAKGVQAVRRGVEAAEPAIREALPEAGRMARELAVGERGGAELGDVLGKGAEDIAKGKISPAAPASEAAPTVTLEKTGAGTFVKVQGDSPFPSRSFANLKKAQDYARTVKMAHDEGEAEEIARSMGLIAKVRPTVKTDQPPPAPAAPAGEAAQAKKNFAEKWAKAYGVRPETVTVAKPEKPVTPEPTLTKEEARKFAKMSDKELAEYNATQGAKEEPQPTDLANIVKMTEEARAFAIKNGFSENAARMYEKAVRAGVVSNPDNVVSVARAIQRVPSERPTDDLVAMAEALQYEGGGGLDKSLADTLARDPESGLVARITDIKAAMGQPTDLVAKAQTPATAPEPAAQAIDEPVRGLPTELAPDVQETPAVAPETTVTPAVEKTVALPSELAGAKPRYKSQILNFESDIDKALYIVAHEGVRSKRDADYMKFLQEQFPDRAPGELRQMGKIVREAAKKKAGKEATEQIAKLHKDVQAQLKGMQKAAKPETTAPVPDWYDKGEVPPVQRVRTPLWEEGAETARAAKGARAEGVGIRTPEPKYGPRLEEGLPPMPPDRRPPGGIENQMPPEPSNPYLKLQEALQPEKMSRRDWLSEQRDRLLRGFYDRTYDLKDIEKATGIPVHKLAQVVPGSTSYGEYEITQKVMPVLAELGKDVKHLEEYMVSMRLQDVLARNPQAKLPGNIAGWGEALKAVATMEQTLGPERFATVKQAAEKMWQLNDELVLKPRLEAGLLSKQQYTAIKSANPHYISFYREDFAGLQTSLAKTGTGPANVTSAGIEALDLAGSTRKLDNPLARFTAQVITTQRLVSENRAAKAILAGLQEMEKAGVEGGAKTPLKTGERFIKVLRPSEAAENSKIWGTISYLEDGKKVTAQVPKVYADIAKGLEVETASAVDRVLSAISAPLRYGAVTYNPAFVVINPIRDAVSALFREGLVPLSPEYIRGWTAAIAKNSDFAEAAQSGALMSGIVDTMRTTDALERATNLGQIKVANAKDALLLVPRLIQQANITSEQATRIAAYYKLKGQGVSQLEAAVRARDVTVDFAKAGNVMKLINQIIPFTNAGVQGASNTLRTMRYSPKQALIGGTPLAMASVMAFLWNQRYETSDMIPDWERTNSWIIQLGEGEKAADPQQPNATPEKFPIYVKIPKGPLGAFLTAPVEMLLNMAWQQDDRSVVEHFLEAGRTALMALSPVEPSLSGLMPPIYQTFQGVTSGIDPYRDSPIVPRREQDRVPETQFGPETSRTAVALGEQFKVSPRMIEWAIKDLGAGAAGQSLWLLDMALGALGYQPEVFGAAKQQPLSTTEALAKTPLISRFVGTRNTQQENRGWDQFDKAVEQSQREFANLPEMRRLGISIGAVADTITVGENVKIRLEAAERAELQTETATVLKALAERVTANANYQNLPDAAKAKVLQQIFSKGREAAKNSYLGRIPREELSRRARESLPVAVGQ